MAFATDAQRRWFFAHLSTGMRRIAGKMKEAESYGKELRESSAYQEGMMEGGMRRIARKMRELNWSESGGTPGEIGLRAYRATKGSPPWTKFYHPSAHAGSGALAAKLRKGRTKLTRTN